MGTWQKFALASVAILLANELIISLVINWKNTPSLLSEQELMAGINEQAFSVDSKVVSPKAKVFAAPSINVSKSDQLDALQHAVLSYNDESKTHHISYRGVYGSWEGRTTDRTNIESFHLASRKNPWLRTSFVSNDANNECTTNFTINTNNVTTSPWMFVPAMFDPTHCIQDLLFSLLPRMASQGRLRDFQAVAVKRPEWSDDEAVRDYEGDYCTLVMRELGWFNDIIVVPNNTCLENLWVPSLMYHRFPRGWAKGTQSSNDYIHSEDLPLEMMHFFQQQMWKSFIAKNKFLYKEKKGRIIFDSRQETGKGEWTNARAIAELVREQLDPDFFVVDVVDDVGALTIEEQAALFQSASIMVAPFGGSIANIIFMRPNAIVFEVSCGESSWVRDWATDLRIRHSVIRADGPPCKFEGHRTYFVQPSTLVELILDICWKGLKKKKPP